MLSSSPIETGLSPDWHLAGLLTHASSNSRYLPGRFAKPSPHGRQPSGVTSRTLRVYSCGAVPDFRRLPEHQMGRLYIRDSDSSQGQRVLKESLFWTPCLSESLCGVDQICCPRWRRKSTIRAQVYVVRPAFAARWLPLPLFRVAQMVLGDRISPRPLAAIPSNFLLLTSSESPLGPG